MDSNIATTLRGKVKQLYREYEAIYVLISAMTVNIKEKMLQTNKSIDKLDRKKLRGFIKDIKKEITELREYYGIKVPNSELIQLLEIAEKGTGSLLSIPKHMLKTFFAHYNKVLPAFNSYPEHIRIGIDIGTFREHQGTVELYLLEVILYENMCALF